MNFCLDRINEGSWVHIYPEGKVNAQHEDLRYKWGVGRLISEAKQLPIVIPIYHLGMDKVLPNKEPYIPHIGQKVTICVGEPIEFEETMKELDERNASAEERRKTITDVIQFQMSKLKILTEIHHSKHTYIR